MIAFEPSVGDVLDARYRILGKLGSGGMGSVYRAEHVGIKKKVAIKLLHPKVAEDPEFTRRFEREALVTGKTSHPNCVTVSDFGKLDDGSHYLVMELVDGVLLADLLDQHERLPVARALHIARHVLRGLAHVHEAGIVHRDVKPTNVILIDQDGDADFAKLCDFGIAKVVTDDAGEPVDASQLTRIGTTVGTPTYVAPEQAIGDVVDGRSDLYSLSVMLYLMLTGEPPFEDEDVVKLLAKHLSAPVPPMLSIKPEASISRDVEELVRRGLAKDRKERWPSAAAYGAAIDAIVARGALERGAPSATPAPWSSLTPPPGPVAVAATAVAPDRARAAGPAGRRRRWIIGGALALVVALIALASRGAGPRKAGAKESAARSAAAASPVAAYVARREDGDALAANADVLLANGRAKETVELLARRSEVAGHGGAQLRLGHALAATDRPKEAIAAYALAAGLDPDTRADPVMRANLVVMGKRRDVEIALPALELLAVRIGDDKARASLIELASKDKRNGFRSRARAIAEPAGWLGGPERVASYLLDLHHGRSCDERRKAVPHLVELDDPRAVPGLEKARRRTSGGILGFGASRANGCMTDELERAIAALSKR